MHQRSPSTQGPIASLLPTHMGRRSMYSLPHRALSLRSTTRLSQQQTMHHDLRGVLRPHHHPGLCRPLGLRHNSRLSQLLTVQRRLALRKRTMSVTTQLPTGPRQVRTTTWHAGNIRPKQSEKSIH